MAVARQHQDWLPRIKDGQISFIIIKQVLTSLCLRQKTAVINIGNLQTYTPFMPHFLFLDIKKYRKN